MKIILPLISLLTMGTTSLLNAQSNATKEVLKNFTREYFEYYNSCKVDKLLELCTEDIEVYHDLAGLITGKTEFGIQSKKFCDWLATPDAPHVKAELVGDLKIHELKTKEDNLYGAVVTGMIDFNATSRQTGKQTKNGRADFTWILRLTNGQWQIARDLSYNHHGGE